MIKMEILLHWFAVALYALSSCLFIYSATFNKKSWLKYAAIIAAAGLIPHTAALALRWVEAGHGPYLRRYEVLSSNAWIVVVMFLFIQWKKPILRYTGVLVLPATFLLIGLGIMSSPEIRPMPDSYQTFWLIVHIFFAKLAYGAGLIGTALAIMYLWNIKKGEDFRLFSNNFLSLSSLDELSYRFISFSFIMVAIMIAAGAIWANQAWGSYWSWDPVETWSLISWVIYGSYLHLRRMHGWRGAKAAWLAIAAFTVLLFALLGIGLIYVTNHSPYLN